MIPRPVIPSRLLGPFITALHAAGHGQELDGSIWKHSG